MGIRIYAPLTLLERFCSGGNSSALFIHQCYSREVWRVHGYRIGLDLLAAVIVWPLGTLGAMARFTGNGSDAPKLASFRFLG